jgi:hypothetical protein
MLRTTQQADELTSFLVVLFLVSSLAVISCSNTGVEPPVSPKADTTTHDFTKKTSRPLGDYPSPDFLLLVGANEVYQGKQALAHKVIRCQTGARFCTRPGSRC